MQTIHTRIIALAAAAAITFAGLAAVNTTVKVGYPTSINGTHVVELAPVHVTPSAEEMRAAVSTGQDVAFAASSPADRAGNAVVALGSQLAMPYYSFAGQLGSVAKD